MDNETCQVTSDACSNGSSPAVTVPTINDSNDVREERTTKKGRRKGPKGKNDENWRYCVQNCLHSGKSPQRTNTMSPVPIVDTPRVRAY